MSKNNILFWYWGRRGGGAAYSYELVKALKNKLYGRLFLSVSYQSEWCEKNKNLHLPTFFINTYQGIMSAILSLFRVVFIKCSFKNYLVKNNISVVICPMTHLWNIFMLPIFKKLNIKYILVVHDAVCHKGEESNIRTWIFKKELDCANIVVALSESVKNQLLSIIANKDKIVTVIPHGVLSYNDGKSKKIVSKEKVKRILFFGRILPYKGLSILLDAFKKLVQKYPYLELEIDGDGDISEYKDKLTNLPNIFLNNRWIDENDIGAIFNRADLLVTPYIEASQSGSIAIALACGMPVVTTPVGGIQEQVLHLKTGVIADKVDSQAFYEALDRIVGDESFYQLCSINSLNFAKNNFSWDHIASEFIGLIETFNKDN